MYTYDLKKNQKIIPVVPFLQYVTALFLILAMLQGCASTPRRIFSNSASMPDILCIKTGFTNAYLIPCNDGYLLIDTGYNDNYQKFLNALNRQNIKVSEIAYIFLTHHHDDHAGFAAQLIKDSHAVVIVHEAAVPQLKLGRNDTSMESLNTCVSVLVSGFKLFHDSTYPAFELTDRDIIITGDDSLILKKIGIPGKIVTTPGHTKDSISIVLENGMAFVGDAAMDLLNICMCNHRPIFIENEEDVFSSWRKLKDSGAKRIFPAHGDPFDVNDLVDN